MPEFETFNRRSAIATKEPMVTIQKGGIISLNAAAFEALGGQVGVVDEMPVHLLFDSTEQIIGIRKAEVGPNTYIVRKQPNSRSYLVTGKAFTRHYGIDTRQARRYKAQIFGNVLGVDLKSDHVEVGRKRAQG